MKFLTDENISPVIVKELRKLKCNVLDIKEGKLRGISDNKLAIIAEREDRIILTHDTTFINEISPVLKVKILIIVFKHKYAARSNMQMVGWFIAKKAKDLFKGKTRVYLKLDSESLKVYPHK